MFLRKDNPMPLYEYRCHNCGHELEARQKFSDDALKTCPNCNQDELFRVMQAAGVVFKGSGFYVTDSRGNRDNLTSPVKKGDDSKSDSTSSSNGDSGKDSKPKKSESKTGSSDKSA
jgi:putative FmdB family regulatory protein